MEKVKSSTEANLLFYLFFFSLFQGVGTCGEAPPSLMVVSEAEVELQREVEELKLRLHMAAEHYKEKYRECQRLRRQVAKLNMSESQGVRNRPETFQRTLKNKCNINTQISIISK